jgi:hypothetical protein
VRAAHLFVVQTLEGRGVDFDARRDLIPRGGAHEKQSAHDLLPEDASTLVTLREFQLQPVPGIKMVIVRRNITRRPCGKRSDRRMRAETIRTPEQRLGSYCDVPSMVKLRNFTYSSPIRRISLRAAESRQA